MNLKTVQANEIDHCEVCGNRTLASVLDLGAHPMCDDLVAIGSPHVCAAKGHVTIHDFFTEATADQIVAAHGKPDFITFTNVFAHIEGLGGVIAALKRLIGDHTVLVIENPYLGSVLLTNQFDTFYHEHPRTYSYRSFVFIARALGLNLIDVQF